MEQALSPTRRHNTRSVNDYRRRNAGVLSADGVLSVHSPLLSSFQVLNKDILQGFMLIAGYLQVCVPLLAFFRSSSCYALEDETLSGRSKGVPYKGRLQKEIK